MIKKNGNCNGIGAAVVTVKFMFLIDLLIKIKNNNNINERREWKEERRETSLDSLLASNFIFIKFIN